MNKFYHVQLINIINNNQQAFLLSNNKLNVDESSQFWVVLRYIQFFSFSANKFNHNHTFQDIKRWSSYNWFTQIIIKIILIVLLWEIIIHFVITTNNNILVLDSHLKKLFFPVIVCPCNFSVAYLCFGAMLFGEVLT